MIQTPNIFVLKSFWYIFFLRTHFELFYVYISSQCNYYTIMRSGLNINNNRTNYKGTQSRVKVTDLLSRLNEEKKIEKKRNLALGVAAVSAVTVFGIILTI